ncbi:MAG: hypothetical protein IKP20_04845 [Candidatus Methanomethylophilaceae archaeon]|nr:hypothetical protein [Candidatus Methanomethylophilaceae archaeon]
MAVPVPKTGYGGCRAYDITADGWAHILSPVEDGNMTLFHAVNGLPVDMAGRYVLGEEGEMYLETHLPPYPVYYLSEKMPGKEPTSNLPLICLVASQLRSSSIFQR